ncbi:MAG: hypothetical protein U0795_01130 [Pirellulales bacterium]
MPTTFDRHGIRFLYADDWNVVDDEDAGGLKTVSVESESGALWSVSVDLSARSPQDLLRETLATMREVYEEVEVSQFQTEVADRPASGCEMEFFCMDLVITARAIAWRDGARSVLVLSQAESREFERKSPVFNAMLASLIRAED